MSELTICLDEEILYPQCRLTCGQYWYYMRNAYENDPCLTCHKFIDSDCFPLDEVKYE